MIGGVVAVEVVAVFFFFSEEEGDEGLAVDFEISGEINLGEFGDGGEEVGHGDEDILLTLFGHAGGKDDEGDVGPLGTIAGALAVAGGAVVSAEDEDGVIGDAHFLELVAVEPDLVVEVVDVSVDT